MHNVVTVSIDFVSTPRKGILKQLGVSSSMHEIVPNIWKPPKRKKVIKTELGFIALKQGKNHNVPV